MSEFTAINAKVSSTSEDAPRILHITTVGVTARVFLLPVLLRLQNEGYEVWCACSDDADARAVVAAGIPFFPVTISRSISPRDIISVFRLYRFMRAQKFTIVNTHTAKAGFTGRLAAWLAGVPVIVHTAHGLTMHEYLSRPVRWLYTVLERWIARRTTMFIAVTRKIRADLLRLNIASPDAIVCIYNGIDFSRFSPAAVSNSPRRMWDVPAAACVIGTISRLVPDKGLEDLIDAFALLRPSCPDAVVVIAGDGELKHALQQRAYDLSLHNSIRWLGWQHDVPLVLTGFDIFCLPTLREGFGYVFLEAQAMGVPVVASDIDPLTETMKKDETALLLPPHSPAALAAALSRLANEPDLRERLSRRAAIDVRRRFSRERQLNALLALYQRLLDRC